MDERAHALEQGAAMLRRHGADHNLSATESRGQVAAGGYGVGDAAAGKKFLVDPSLRDRFADVGFVRPQTYAVRAFAAEHDGDPGAPRAPADDCDITHVDSSYLRLSSQSRGWKRKDSAATECERWRSGRTAPGSGSSPQPPQPILSARRGAGSIRRVREIFWLRWWLRCCRCRCGVRPRRGRCGRGGSRKGWSPGGSWRRRFGGILALFQKPSGFIPRAERPRYCRRDAGATLNRRYFRSNLASCVYFDPFGDRWLWYKKNSRGVMVPNPG